MGKVLLYASIAVTLATTALGFINKNKLSAKQGELVAAEQAVKDKTKAIEKAQQDLKAATVTLQTDTSEKEKVAAQAEALKADVEKNKTQVADLTKQIADKTAEATKLAADLEEAKKKAEASSATVAAPAATPDPEKEEQKTLITKLQGDLEASRSQLEALRKKDTDRTASKMRSGLEGRILAVNQAWNFVILNLGDKNGVVGNAEMLIKRGNQLVGKVRVTSVEPSTSVADIVANSIPRGFSIQPGDNVIYQATAE